MPDHPGDAPDLETGARQDPRPAVEEPHQRSTAKRERMVARRGDVSEGENEKVGKKRGSRGEPEEHAREGRPTARRRSRSKRERL